MAGRLSLLFVALPLLTHGFGAFGAPTPEVPCHQGNGPRFTSFESLPSPVPLDLLGRFAPEVPTSRLAAMAPTLMARRDADWQVTDVVRQGPALPGRRFILGTQGGDRLLVWYESGGIAHMFHVVVFDRGGSSAWSVSRHLSDGSLVDLCHRLEAPGASVYDQFW